MCGICGFVGSDDERLVTTMTRLLAHRGPDGEGIRVFPASGGRPPATLGHRRLSIIDPSPRGAQPMAWADGRYWITYNGELYNFRKLRADLEREGTRFRTECDTEVLIAMYARYGSDCLHHLNGIFAFAIWDVDRGELFLARDRLGVKPLYYATDAGRFYFASEVKSLLPALRPPRVNSEALADYLTFLWTPDPDTLFEGIHKLPPGHFATFAGDRLSIHEYWDMSYAADERSESEWIDAVREGVQAAVRRQLVSDVPLGSFLSGGLDSSAIVATMVEREERVTTFTVGFKREDLAHEVVPDDLAYARRVARLFDVSYNERILEPNVVELLPKLVWHLDDLVADPAAISTYLICAAAGERLKVILSGMGGDEVFAGYPRYLAAQIGRAVDLSPVSVRRVVRRALEPRLTLGPPGRLRATRRNLMKALPGLDADPLGRHLIYTSYYRESELRRLLSEDLRDGLAAYDPFRHHRAYLDRAPTGHWLNTLLYVDLKTYLPSLNLAYTDKMSMAASTEVRVPLLDDEMLTLTGSIPPGLKLRRFTRKYVLKRSFESVLPRDVVWRPKAGFGAPIRAWLVRDLEPMIDELLAPAVVKERGLLDPREVTRLVEQNRSGQADNALRIWALLTLELWFRTFIDAGSEVRTALGNVLADRRMAPDTSPRSWVSAAARRS
jgi:asparagine synthase (glutamine-hydrolysing)